MAERKLPNFFLSKRVPCFQSTPNVQLRLESEVASWFSRVNVNQACMPFLPAARRWPAAMPAWQRQARVARVVETVGSFCPLSENTRTTTVWSGAVSMYSIHDVQQGVLRVTLKDFTRKGRLFAGRFNARAKQSLRKISLSSLFSTIWTVLF